MKNTVMTIGNFDGLHKGHLKLIAKVLSLSEKHNLKSLVCSFDTNTKLSELLFPQNQLKEYLSELGINYYRKLNFLRDIKDLSCEEFVEKYIFSEFGAKYVVVGEDFCFGKGKSGNADTMSQLGKKYGFKTIVIKLLKRGENVVSSTYIRTLIKNTDLKASNSLMYKPLSVLGIVKKGYNIGTKILFPTANISVPKNFVPLNHGVYKTKTTIDKVEYDSITNIGYSPIKKKNQPTIETYILSFSGDLYGKRIKLNFLKYIRNERPFENAEELKKQIRKDILKCGL